MVSTLLVDNYDSFTYNLYALLAAVNGTEPAVNRNDSPWDAVDFDRFDNVVISAGPGTPTQTDDFGISAVSSPRRTGRCWVCAWSTRACVRCGGPRVERAPEPVHGRLSTIVHTGEGLFRGLPLPLVVVRYHSLVVTDLPAEFEVTARTTDGLIMAVRFRNRPMWGAQFHPESIASEKPDEFSQQHTGGSPTPQSGLGTPVRRGLAAPPLVAP
jgi:para-aminobenzoate synthetase